MAGIGMLYMVAAPVTSHTDGNPITYGEGFEVGPSVAADLSFNSNDNPDMGDDVVIDNDTGITGYSGTVENNFLDETIAAKLYGWPLNSQSNEYAITSMSSPHMGFGYIKKCLDKGVLKFRAFWFLKAQFQLGSYVNARTKPNGSVDWQHDTSNISGIGAVVDSTGDAHYVIPKTFTTFAAAQSWLKGKANISG